MAGMKALREEAKAAGIPAKAIRSAESSAELRKLIRESSNGTSSTPRKKAVVKKAVKRGRGRPKGSTSKATPSRKASAKRTTRKAASNGGNGGRNTLSGVKFSQTDGWNPREGSVPDVIVKALRKAKGDRGKAFTALKGKLNTLVPKKTRGGRSRNQSEREQYLRYLISRNAWAFALATGQHEASDKRVEYGTGGTGEGKFKRNRKSARKASGGTKSKGRGKTAAKARKPAAAKRGRPKGSKNKR